MKSKPLLLSVAALVSSVFLTGAPSACDPENWLDPDRYAKLQEPPAGKISIHSIVRYRYGDSTEQTIATYSGREITINTVPFLTSKEIEKIALLPHPGRPGYYDLQVTLTPQRGRHLWIGLSNAGVSKNEELAFVIDGMFYRGFRPRLLQTDSDTTVIIDGPFDSATAQELAANADFNYIKLNRR